MLKDKIKKIKDKSERKRGMQNIIYFFYIFFCLGLIFSVSKI